MQETDYLVPKKSMKVVSVLGTRPEAIKMAPLVKTLSEDAHFQHFLVVTGQHREMLDQMLKLFSLKADYDLNIMEERQSLASIINKASKGLERILKHIAPDLVLVHGDTTTTLVGALVAFYQKIKVAHVEAGLRSGDRLNPFPEEMNRVLTDQIADIHFAPTAQAKMNLLHEEIAPQSIFVTGNTVVDALLALEDNLDEIQLPDPLKANRPFVLVEIHRRENWGEPLKQLALGLADIARDFPWLDLAISLHPNPIVRETMLPILEQLPNVKIFEPFNYLEFLSLIKQCLFVITDSGGIQEEAPSFGKLVLVTRKVTERPEGVQAGVLKIVGTERTRLVQECRELLEGKRPFSKERIANPFGDGIASLRIRDYLLYLYFNQERPSEFAPNITKLEEERDGCTF